MDMSSALLIYSVPGHKGLEFRGNQLYINGTKMHHMWSSRGWIVQLNGRLVKVTDLIAAVKLGRPLKPTEAGKLLDGFLPNAQFNNVEILSND